MRNVTNPPSEPGRPLASSLGPSPSSISSSTPSRSYSGEATYSAALEAFARASRIDLGSSQSVEDFRARLNRKSQLATEALRQTQETIDAQPYEGRAFGHRLTSRIFLDLAESLERLGVEQPALLAKSEKYRSEVESSLRRCASFDSPSDVVRSCRESLAPTAASGDDPSQLIAAIVQHGKAGLDRCFYRAIQSLEQSQEWKTTLHFNVGPDGHVTQVRLDPEPQGLPLLASCIFFRVARWEFPPPGRDGESLDLEIPLVFRAVDDTDP